MFDLRRQWLGRPAAPDRLSSPTLRPPGHGVAADVGQRRLTARDVRAGGWGAETSALPRDATEQNDDSQAGRGAMPRCLGAAGSMFLSRATHCVASEHHPRNLEVDYVGLRAHGPILLGGGVEAWTSQHRSPRSEAEPMAIPTAGDGEGLHAQNARRPGQRRSARASGRLTGGRPRQTGPGRLHRAGRLSDRRRL